MDLTVTEGSVGSSLADDENTTTIQISNDSPINSNPSNEIPSNVSPRSVSPRNDNSINDCPRKDSPSKDSLCNDSPSNDRPSNDHNSNSHENMSNANFQTEKFLNASVGTEDGIGRSAENSNGGDDVNSNSPSKIDGNTSSNTSINNSDTDAEGLRKRYDVVICGTGLIQSILASALARANRAVLHCDSNDSYGELDAVYTYPYLRLRQQHQTSGQHSSNKHSTVACTSENYCDPELLTDTSKGQRTSYSSIPLHESGSCKSLRFHSCSPLTCNDKTHAEMAPVKQTTQTTHTFLQPLKLHDIVWTPYGYATIVHISAMSNTSQDAHLKNKCTCCGMMHLELLPPPNSLPSSTGPTIFVGLPSQHITTFGTPSATPSVQTPNDRTCFHDPTSIVESNTNPCSTSSRDDDSRVTAVDGRYMYEKHNILSVTSLYIIEILERRSRSIALDLSPTLLFASGPAVSALLKSGVADYLDFQSCLGLFVYRNDNINNNNIAPTTSRSKQNHHQPLLSRVPCSKNDVFASQMLSPIEKRRLMKFLQLAYDYAIILSNAPSPNDTSLDPSPASDETSIDASTNNVSNSGSNINSKSEVIVQTRNEKHLNTGRALGRPQNKSVQSEEMIKLQEYCRSSTLQSTTTDSMMSLETYLSQHQQLSPSLIRLVQYALALDIVTFNDNSNPNSNSNSDSNSNSNCTNMKKREILSLKDGMERLCRHMGSLGHFGSTAFLVPLYGSGELSQAFCRSAAVYGATYLLRRTPRAIILAVDHGADMHTTGSRDSQPSSESPVKLHGVIIDHGHANTQDYDRDDNMDTKPNSFSEHVGCAHKLILCEHIIAPKQALRVQDDDYRHAPKAEGGDTGDDVNDLQSPLHTNNRSHHYPRHRVVVRRTSILKGKPYFPTTMPSSSNSSKSWKDMLQDQHSHLQIRYVVIIPPGTIVRSSVTVSTNDPLSTMAAIVVPNPIHAIFLDESVHVVPTTPSIGGCTMVHLTTTAMVDDSTKDSNVEKSLHMLQVVLESILDDCNTQYKVAKNVSRFQEHNKSGKSWEKLPTDVEEIFHVGFSYELDDYSYEDIDDSNQKIERNNIEPNIKIGCNVCNENATKFYKTNVGCGDGSAKTSVATVPGVHLIHRDRAPDISPDDAFLEAERIFRRICPGDDFLALSQSLRDEINERLGVNGTVGTTGSSATGINSDDDHDRHVLESAVGMIAASAAPTTSTGSVAPTTYTIATSVVSSEISNDNDADCAKPTGHELTNEVNST